MEYVTAPFQPTQPLPPSVEAATMLVMQQSSLDVTVLLLLGSVCFVSTSVISVVSVVSAPLFGSAKKLSNTSEMTQLKLDNYS